MGVLFQKYFAKLHGCGVGVNLQNVFLGIAPKCLGVHRNLTFGNIIPTEHSFIHSLKIFMMEIQWNVQNYTKLMFFIPQPPQGVGIQFIEKEFAGNCMKCPECHKNVKFGNLHYTGKGTGP